MNIKFKILWLSASLALMSSMIVPAVADEWNKETKLEFSGPVEVPGNLAGQGHDGDRGGARLGHAEEGGLFCALAHTAAGIQNHIDPVSPIGRCKRRKLDGKLSGHTGYEKCLAAGAVDCRHNVGIEK